MKTLKTPTEIATSLVVENTTANCILLNGVGVNRETIPTIRAADVQRIINGVATAIELDRAQAREVDASSCYAAYLDALAGRPPVATDMDVRAAIALGCADKDTGTVQSKAEVTEAIKALLAG